MTASPEDRAAEILRRFQRAQSNRGNWEGQWEEIARRILPSYSGSFNSNGVWSPGAKKTDDLVDATGALALPRFAAAMESMLTPRGSKWHSLVSSDRSLMRNRQARLWFDDATDALFRYRYAPRANFASVQHESYMSLGAFGTGVKYIDALRSPGEKGLRYSTIHLGQIYFLVNHQGIVDTMFRRFPMTARQAYQRFGDELPPDIVEKAKDTGKCETEFWFVNSVYPRSEDEGYDPARYDVKGMRYADCYVSETGKKLIEEKGFRTFPYPVSRYVVAPGEEYGRSPAMLVLPALKTLNEEKKTILKQGHRSIDPVLLAHDDGIIDGFSLRPGAINPGGVNADGRPLVHALPVGNLALAKEMLEDERNTINDAFLVTLFQILVETPQMTATEVLERAREKGALLSPTMGRQQSEDLGVTIEREMDVLAQQGLLPPMPPILQQARAEYDVVYSSPLSRQQRAEEGAGLMRTLDWAKEYVAVSGDPSPLDWFDWDAIMPDLADIQAVPQRWLRDMAAVAAVRQSRAQAQQTQQMVDAAPAAASLAKTLPQGLSTGG